MSRTLARDRTALVVVDVQEAFRPAVGEFDAVAGNAARLVQGARILGLPVLVTEQYPRGLGATVPEVAEYLDGVPRLEKVEFDATRVDGFGGLGRFADGGLAGDQDEHAACLVIPETHLSDLPLWVAGLR